MSDSVELEDVPALFQRWLAGRPLADRSRREYARNVRAYLVRELMLVAAERRSVPVGRLIGEWASRHGDRQHAVLAEVHLAQRQSRLAQLGGELVGRGHVE